MKRINSFIIFEPNELDYNKVDLSNSKKERGAVEEEVAFPISYFKEMRIRKKDNQVRFLVKNVTGYVWYKFKTDLSLEEFIRLLSDSREERP